jgi:hypothetical protein
MAIEDVWLHVRLLDDASGQAHAITGFGPTLTGARPPRAAWAGRAPGLHTEREIPGTPERGAGGSSGGSAALVLTMITEDVG